MTIRQPSEVLAAHGEIVAPPRSGACNDQSFELPSGIYVAMAMMFAGFVGVLSLAFRGGHLAVIYCVIFAFIAAFFAIPALFPAVIPKESRRGALGWFDFGHRGIRTATGRTSAGEATVLVLLLPFLIMCFAIAVAVIAAVIR